MTAWSTVTWEDLVAAAGAFGAGGDAAYLRCYALLRADRSMLERAEHSGELVRFLNSWAARLDRAKAPAAFGAWIRGHADELELLDATALTDPAMPRHAQAVDELYESLMGLRSVLRNMSDAAASKALHQLLPGLVVMWDRTIKQWAIAQGCASYGAYLVAMHELATRLLGEIGMGLAEAELQLQERLAYPARKPLTQTLDEANVHWASAARTV